ncbi:MAG: pyridoxal phosphate-dependent aminotransferase family protein [Bacteroidota bacterium]
MKLNYPKSFEKLDERLQDGSLRKLIVYDSENQVDFFSNDYLGLSRTFVEVKKNPLIQNGSTGSRLISGNSNQAEDLEKFLAHFFETESALVFNSGYDANLGLFSSIGTRNDLIIYDELIHASVRDGIRLSLAKSFSFKHNSLKNLQKKVKLFRGKNPSGDIFVAIESLYSMDGDFAPLYEIAQFCFENNLFLLVDEAHSGGVFGKEGRGLCSELAINELIFAKIITFGKAYGSHGAVVLGSQKLKDYLINFARSFIYTTALPANHYYILKQLIEFSRTIDFEENRANFQKNISLFRGLNARFIQFSSENSPIQILVFENLEKTKNVVKLLSKAGFSVKVILSPTVPKGKERIRICLHSFNTIDEIRKFSEILN